MGHEKYSMILDRQIMRRIHPTVNWNLVIHRIPTVDLKGETLLWMGPIKSLFGVGGVSNGSLRTQKLNTNNSHSPQRSDPDSW